MSRIPDQKPTRTPREGHPVYDYDEAHPGYGKIGASRRSSNGHTLFASDFRHNGFVVITIMEASLNRGLSSDYIHGGKEYIQVALSEAQWATFVSTLNMGDGVPCTIQWTREDGYIPGIELDSNRRDQFNKEIDDDLQEAIRLATEIRDAAPTKKARDKAEHLRMKLVDSLPYVAKRFDEHAEETVEKAKIEVEAYVTRTIQRAGLEAISSGGSPIVQLSDGKTGDSDGA